MSLFEIGPLKARPAQEFMASLVQKAIDGNKTCLIQAATGIGKTLAYVAPALKSGRRTVVSVPTRQLQRQVLKEVERLEGSAVLRVGMANFFSRSRINRLITSLQSDSVGNGELLAQLRVARDWGGLIEEFSEEHGDLLIDRSLVCLRPGCPIGDRGAYDDQKREAAGSSFVIQTHALTLLDIRYGRHDADVTIFDEAHTLPSIAAGSVEARVLLSEVGLDSLAERLGNQDFVLLSDDDRDQIKEARELVEDEELKLLLGRIAAPIKTLKQGAGIVAKPLPCLQRVSIDPARFVGWNLKGRPSIFVSATLDPIEQFRSALGLEDTAKEDIGVSQFGSMKITVADRRVPVPFMLGQPSDEFYACAAAMVRATEGRTLVLVPSYDDVERLGALVPELQRHERGRPISSIIERFKIEGGKVITPVAWEGLDLPHLIDDLVIVRLPLAPRSELRERVLELMLDARGYDTGAARRILQSQARADALRRMAQGVGRGIRAPDDQVRLWIADPRFPIPAGWVRDPRKMLSQGAASGFLDFGAVIPERFRVGLRSEYEKAVVFSSGGK